MGRAPCCEKIGIKKGRWTAEEDKILSDYILSNGEGSWRSLPKNAGLKRCGKSCRLRWINYLRSDLKRGNITPEEEDLIVKLHSTMGNRWSIIASNLPGRTDNEIKNYWNSHLSRKLHSYFRKSTVENNALMPPKRRLGRTSRSAMKPKLIINPKTHVKNTRKTVKNDVVLPVATKENGEGRQEEALMVLSSSNLSGPCDNGDEHGGSCKQGINGDDNGVLCFNDDIFDAWFLLDEPHAVHVSSSDDQSNNLEDSGVKRGFESSNDVVVTDQMVVDDFVDWDFVWREGEDLWNGKESLDSMSWEEIESEIRQSESNGFEPLDPLDDENAMVGWLLS